MKRNFEEYLKKWKSKSARKPLIIRGARQVGKTYVVEQFGKQNYDVFIKVNFEEKPELKDFFQTNDVNQIKQNLEIYFEQKIVPNKTLLFLDEIQACPQAIITLRYFYEKNPELHVIAAGSLLDHTLNNLKYSMPVGRIELGYMYPLDFYEFLDALGKNSLVEFLKNYDLKENIPPAIHNKLLEQVRLYYLAGGMPEAVKVFINENSFAEVENVHESIIKTLEYDFGKYGTRKDQENLVKTLRYLPKSIGKKFKYRNVAEDERTENIKRAVNLLRMSRIVHFVYNTTASKVPLESGVKEKVFKPIFMDIGLANHILKLRLLNVKNLITENEGDLAEQFVGQQFLTMFPKFIDAQLYYWQREKRNAESEIDFVSENENRIIPIEVKAGKTGSLKSLHIYIAEKKLNQAVRFNIDFPSKAEISHTVKIGATTKDVKYQLLSLPLYLVREYGRLIGEKN